MSETKRVAFTTISNSTSSSVNSNIGGSSSGGQGLGASPFSASGGNDAMATSSAALHRFGVPDPVTSQKSGASGSSTVTSKLSNKTIRLNLELFASNSNTFPEFNYSKLIHLEKKKLKKLKSNNKQNGFSDPFEENDDDVARIAKELEKKYGTSYASGRGRSKKDDFCDIGLGYDENDSFIDNTEAYDEIIPEEVETVEGGFYINSGALVFKQLSCTEKTDEIIKMPNKTRKRALSSSSEESGSSDEEKDLEKETDGPTPATTSNVANSQQQSAISKNGTQLSNKQKNTPPSEKRHKSSSDRESSDKEKSTKSSKSSSAATSSVTSVASGSPKNDDIVPETSSKDKQRIDRTTVKTTTVKDMLKAKRDSFLKMQEEELKSKTSNGEVKATISNEDKSGSDSSSDESDVNMEPTSKKLKKSDEDSDKLRSSDTPLPDLNDELLRDVHNIKDTAKANNRIGKKFQFDDKLTDLFLSVDDRCLCLDKSVRNNVFAHLEYQLSLPKYFLLRKAKQLRINQEKTKTKKAFVKLRKAVTEAMQHISQQYQTNLTKYEEFQSLNPGSDVHKMENAPKMPKKRFHWNDTTRSLLYELYQVRWMSYSVLGTRKESFEDFISNFLKDKVINIWPSGWMKVEEVKREIEKKKNAPKKLKENKKPEESVPAFSSTSEKQNSLNQESGSSKLSINTTDNHPTMAASSETASLKPNDVTKLLPAHSNSTTATTEHMHSSKAYSSSSSSGKLQRSSTNSPLNLCSSQSGSKNEKSSTSGVAVINNNNNANPNQNLNTNRPSSTGIVNISKSLIDLVSPSKRTDHSINSIMSSPSSTSSSVSTTPQPQHSGIVGAAGGCPMGSSLSGGVDSNTHVINIDNCKSATEIINTSNQILGSHSNKTHSQNDRQKGGRSSALDVHHSHNHASMKSEFRRRDSSSESDGVEIVGVFPARSTASTLPVANKNKYKKSSHQESRSDSPGLHDKLKTAAANVASKKSLECTELDVNKIMKALKELEELQQTGNFVPDISSFANSNHNANTSPLAYGKDLTQ